MLTYEDGMEVQLFDHVEIGEWEHPFPGLEEWIEPVSGQVVRIFPRKRQVKVRVEDGFTCTGKPAFSSQAHPIGDVNLIRRDG